MRSALTSAMQESLSQFSGCIPKAEIKPMLAGARIQAHHEQTPAAEDEPEGDWQDLHDQLLGQNSGHASPEVAPKELGHNDKVH